LVDYSPSRWSDIWWPFQLLGKTTRSNKGSRWSDKGSTSCAIFFNLLLMTFHQNSKDKVTRLCLGNQTKILDKKFMVPRTNWMSPTVNCLLMLITPFLPLSVLLMVFNVWPAASLNLSLLKCTPLLPSWIIIIWLRLIRRR
jgi:sterol desaturase/sphingolipid hydroxylase (fatty acid hydroxylase superfamily)